MLAGQLPEEIHAVAQSMLTGHKSLRILILPVIREPELRDIGGNAESSHACDRVVGQILVKCVVTGTRKTKSNAAIVEAELIRPPGADDISVRERPTQGGPYKIVIKAGQVV